MPVIWDTGYDVDFGTTAFTNLRNYCNKNGITYDGAGRRLFSIGFCPCQQKVNDGEFQFPSYVGGTDFSSQWYAVGYSDSVAQTALASIAGKIATVFPGMPIQFAYLNATQQPMGAGADGGTLASAWFAAMNTAAVANGGSLMPVQQSVTTGMPLSNWAIAKGASLSRLFTQMVTGYTKTSDINACLDFINTIPNVQMIQVHAYQAQQAYNHLYGGSGAAPSAGGIISFGGRIIGLKHKQIVSIGQTGG